MPNPFDLASIVLPPDSEVARLLAEESGVACVKFGDGEYLVRAGEPRQDVYLILRGSCLVQREGATSTHRSGDELAVIEARPDAPVFVGETAYLAATPRTASVRAAMNVWALHMRPEHLDHIIARYPQLTRTLCRQFATRLAESNAALARLREASAMPVAVEMAEPGAVIFQAGEPGTTLYLLIDGAVRLEHADGTHEDLRPSPVSPCFLGAAAFLRRSTHPHTARALHACVFNTVDTAHRDAALRNFPALIEALL